MFSAINFLHTCADSLIRKGVIYMANISWTSSSINSFFNNSLGNPTSAFGSLYSSLGDASLIKRGTYHKLMDSYYSTVKNSDSRTDTSSKTDTSKDSTSTDKTTKKKTHANKYTYDSTAKSTTKISNKVLDELLDKTEKKSTITNSVLNDLLKKDDTSTTYDSSAQKNTASDATAIDQTV